MKKLVAMALSLTLAVSMLTACGGTKETKAETSAETTAETSGETTAAADGESLKVALCVTGAVNDMGFCQSAYEGLVLLEEKYGAEIAYTENLQAADMAAAQTMQQMAMISLSDMVSSSVIRPSKSALSIRIQHLSVQKRT